VAKKIESPWQEFLNLGEELLRLPNTLTVVQKLEATVDEKLHSRSKLWLCDPYYPLPGEPPVDVLPSEDCPQLVLESFRQKAKSPNSANQHQTSASSEIALPLTTRDNTLGIFHITRSQMQPFTSAELEYLEALCAFAAVSMQVNRQVTLKN